MVYSEVRTILTLFLSCIGGSSHKVVNFPAKVDVVHGE